MKRLAVSVTLPIILTLLIYKVVLTSSQQRVVTTNLTNPPLTDQARTITNVPDHGPDTADGDATVSKLVSPIGTVAAGGVLRYTIIYTNAGLTDTTNLLITDVLPVHTTFLEAGEGGAFEEGLVTWQVGTVPTDDSVAVHFRVQVSESLTQGWSITNVAHISSDQMGVITTNVATNTVDVMPDFGLSQKKAEPNGKYIGPGDLITYSILYTNSGTFPAADVVITDYLPAHTTYVTGGTHISTERAVRFEVEKVDVATGGVFSFTVRVDDGAPAHIVVANVATIVSNQTSPVTTEPVTRAVRGPSLILHKAVTPTGAVLPGTILTYTLAYANRGDVDATGVTITDPLPAGLVYLNGGDPGQGEVLSWTVGVLPVGVSGTVTFTAWASNCVPVVNNQAYLRSDQRGLQSSNIVPISILAPLIQVRKGVTPPGQVPPKGLLTYTLQYTNAGIITATNVVLLDLLPHGVEYVTSEGGHYISTPTGVISFPLGKIHPGDGGVVTLTVQVTSTSGVRIVNFAQVFYDGSYPLPYVSDQSLDVPGSGSFGLIGGNGVVDYVAQSFIATAPRLKRAGIHIYGDQLPYPDVRVRLWDSDADNPDHSHELAVGPVIIGGNLSSEGQRYFVMPRYPISLRVGARYWLVVDGLVDTSSSGSAGVKYAAGDPYADGGWVYSSDGGGSWEVWDAETDLDVRVDYASPAQSNRVSNIVVNRRPYTPTALSPPAGATDVLLAQTLSWLGGDPDGDPVTYTVAFGTGSVPPVVSDTVVMTTYDPSDLQLDTTYHWAIEATDGLSVTSGGPWDFTTTSGVRITGPMAGVTGISYTFFASMTASARPPITYVWRATERSGRQCVTSGLIHSTTFAWGTTGTKAITVTAMHDEGEFVDTHLIAVGPSFTVYLPIVMRSWPPIPPQVYLYPPDNSGGGSTYTVYWHPITDTQSIIYVLEEAKDVTFGNPSEIYRGPIFSYTVSSRGPGHYTYRVKACNPWRCGEWSNGKSVDVIPEVPELHLVRSADGDGKYTLSWRSNPSTQPLVYVLQEDAGYGCGLSDATLVYSGANTLYVATDHMTGRFRYRVKACTSGNKCSAWSNVERADVSWEQGDNNSRAHANGPLVSGKDYFGYPDDWWDCFKINLQGSGNITAELFDHTGTGTILYLSSLAKNPIRKDRTSPYSISYEADEGEYFVCIYTKSGHNSADRYRLHVTFPSLPDVLPNVPQVDPISVPDGKGDYAICWSEVTNTKPVTYFLHEAKDSTFAGSVRIHHGPSTCCTVNHKGAGRHYYRVRACGRCGCGSWSAGQWVDVLWEQEPNDSLSQASGPLISDEDYYGYHDDTWDCFLFSAYSGGEITLDLVSQADTGVLLELLGQTRTLVKYDSTPPYHIEHIGAVGQYHACIFTNQNLVEDPPYTYTLRATFSSAY